jgi:transcriptional regulator with XRE-family HTH domain
MTFAGVKISLRKRFGLRVKELRLATGLSQEAFADRCGFARSYMSRIERGAANPSLDAVEVLAQALGVMVSELFIESAPHAAAAGSVPLVPFARDGSYFGRSTVRPETQEYNVGGKGRGNTKRFKEFDEALAYLQTMTPAKWWRPNKSGKWGLVTAVRWEKLPD